MALAPIPMFKMPLSLISVMAIICLIPVLGYLAPRSFAFLPAVLAIASAFAVRGKYGQWASINIHYMAIVLLIIGLGLISSFWAINPDAAFERSLKIAIVLIPGAFLFSHMQMLKIQDFPGLERGFAYAVIISAALLCVDLYTHNGLYYALHPTDKDIDNFSDLNRSTMCISFLALFALYFLKDDWKSKRHSIALALIIISLLAVLLKTDSQSAQLFIIVAVLLALLFPVNIKAAWCGLAALILLGFAAAPWIAQYMFNELAVNVGAEGWLAKGYASARMEIWDFIARKALENPLYGFGMDATRQIPSFDTQLLYANEDHVLHPHNFVMQIWLEFGAVGAALMALILLFILYCIYKIEDAVQKRFCLSVFISLIIIAAMSYGLWQGWWLGLFVLVASFCALILPKSAS